MQRVEKNKRLEELKRRLAHIISEATNPLFVALPTFLLVDLRTASTITIAFLWWGITVIGLTIAPLVVILSGVRQGYYRDHHLSQREQRLIPLLLGLVCVLIVFLCLFFLRVSHALMATMVAVMLVGIVTTIVTRYCKISLHLIGITGSITVLSLVLHPLFILLSPLVALVGWARWQMEAHTVFQIVVGAALALGLTLTSFWLFGLL